MSILSSNNAGLPKCIKRAEKLKGAYHFEFVNPIDGKFIKEEGDDWRVCEFDTPTHWSLKNWNGETYWRENGEWIFYRLKLISNDTTIKCHWDAIKKPDHFLYSSFGEFDQFRENNPTIHDLQKAKFLQNPETNLSE